MKIFKTTAIIFLTLAIAVTTGIAILQIDDELNSEVLQTIYQLEKRLSASSKAYLYLNGFSAPEKDSVLYIGKQRLKNYKLAEKNLEPIDLKIEYKHSDESLSLFKPSDTNLLYCKLWETECLESIVNKENRWVAELEFHQTLITRYIEYLEYSDFLTLTKPTLYEKYPEYNYLSFGNRLQIFNALILANKGHPLDAMYMLINDIKKLKKQLVVADSIMHKVLFTSLIANNLDIVSYISSVYNSNEKINIPMLSVEETSFDLLLNREFTFAYYMLMAGDKNPELFEIGRTAPSWIIRMVYKPHMTVNTTLELYKEIALLSKLPPFKFAKSKFNSNNTEINLRNISGNSLSTMSGESLHALLARVYDLNIKITLANYIINGRKEKLVNPYYPSKTIDMSNNEKICLNGPNEDKRNLRCIQLRFSQ